jgi:hypothetical protein
VPGQPLGQLIAGQAVLELVAQRDQLDGVQRQLVERVESQVTLQLALVGLQAVQRPGAGERAGATKAALVGSSVSRCDIPCCIPATHSRPRKRDPGQRHDRTASVEHQVGVILCAFHVPSCPPLHDDLDLIGSRCGRHYLKRGQQLLLRPERWSCKHEVELSIELGGMDEPERRVTARCAHDRRVVA